MKVPFAIIVILVVFPISVCLFAILGRSFYLRLAVWTSAGYFMSQWMQVMIFVLLDHIAGSTTPTEMNLFYFIHIKWWWALIVGFVVSASLATALVIICSKPESIDLRILGSVMLVAVILSQVTGSSIPKLSGDVALALLFLLGCFSYRYLLSYPPNMTIPASQMQSDALTALGLLVGLVSIIAPFLVILADFLWKYFAEGGLLFQFQITRFAAIVAWTMMGIGMIAFEALKILIEARNRAVF
jgi:hypothetical protein